MRIRRIHISLAFTVLLLASCRVNAHALDPITVPFILRGGHIYMSGLINGAPVTLVLDSGAGANVVTPQAAQRLGLKPGRSGTAVGAGGQATDIHMATLASLEVGGANSEKQTAYIIPLPDALKCDGLLGTPFFRQWVITIDYDTSKITLTTNGQFVPSPDATEFLMHFKSETVHIEATIDGFKGLFKVDTGAADTLTLFSPFVEKNGLRSKYTPSIEMVTGRGVGGLVYGTAVRVPGFSIGPFEFKNVTATLSRQTKGVFADADLAGNIGEDILRRFRVTFDHANKRLYLSKSTEFDKPFVGNRSGLGVDYVAGVSIARSVIAGSPAAGAGIQEGDTIVGIDDRTGDHFQPWELRDLLYGDVGSKVTLKVQTANHAPREVEFTLRELY
jgi:predicted aspartyl protease